MMRKTEKIQNEIRMETPERPQSLSKEAVCDRLRECGVQPFGEEGHLVSLEKVKSEGAGGRKLALVAAALAVTVLAIFIGSNGTDFMKNGRFSDTEQTAQTELTTGQLTTAAPAQPDNEKGYEQIKNYFLSLKKKNDAIKLKTYNSYNYVLEGDAAAAPSVTVAAAEVKSFGAAAETATGESQTESYGKTNTQVDGVDEADIIKNDGQYIYSVTDYCTVNITDALEMKNVSKLKLESEKKDQWISVLNMYVNGDRLVLVCSQGSSPRYGLLDGLYGCGTWYGSNETVSLIYDISDRSAPVLLRRVSQDGSNCSSRMTGNILYNVSCYRVDVYEDEQQLKKDCVPTVNGQYIPYGSIYWEKDKDTDSTNYIILTAMDITSPDGEVKTVSMLGSADEVYCTESSMFISEQVYTDNGCDTKIYAFTVNGTDLQYRTSGTVPGTPLNQFSLDEYNGYFRIATTAYDYQTYVDVSSLYVLDGNMKTVGKLENLAYDESIRSVRFMGNTAYVVTFLNTDPLFVIDLTDPASPVVKGEVKLPGFSAYLHPVGEGLVVGVGYGGDENDADYCSVKVSLFDVRDPEKPIEVNNVVIKNSYSSIDGDPKSFMYYPEKNIIGIPLELREENAEPIQSLCLLKVTPTGLQKLTGLTHCREYRGQYFRGTYIGENIYTVTQTLLKRFTLTDYSQTGSTELTGYAEKENGYRMIVEE